MGKTGLGQKMQYDINKMLVQIEEAAKQGHRSFDLHGGEPLMTPKKDAERLFAAMAKYNDPLLQTNGFLIDDEWIAMFVKYDVCIGVSIDGEGDLNTARGFFDPEGIRINPASDEYTKKVMESMKKMRDAGLEVSVICVLNRFNALPEPRQRLKKWLLKLKEIGVTGGRLNLAYVDDPQLKPMLELTPEEAKEAWVDLADFVLADKTLNYLPFREFVDNLMGLGLGPCHYRGCDPDKTDGEVVIGPEGDIQNCSRLYAEDGQRTVRKDGLQGNGGSKREDELRKIPMSEGGCSGCKYWHVCYGGCPGQGEKNGKKNVWAKDRMCLAIYGVYESIEDKLHGMMPNVRTVPETLANTKDAEWLKQDKRHRIQNQWGYRAFGYLSYEFTKSPSSFSTSAKVNKRQDPLVKEG
jgi:uncharacterized protein